jgi:hypothetical protein
MSASVFQLQMTVISVSNMHPTLATTLTCRLQGYIGDDHPHELPLHVPAVALKVENSDRYGLSSYGAWMDWRSTDAFPHGNGFVDLGPEGELHRTVKNYRLAYETGKDELSVMKNVNLLKYISPFRQVLRCFTRCIAYKRYATPSFKETQTIILGTA